MSHITEEKCIEILTECSELLEEEIDLNKMPLIIERINKMKVLNYKMAAPNEPTGLIGTLELVPSALFECGFEPGCGFEPAIAPLGSCDGCGFCD